MRCIGCGGPAVMRSDEGGICRGCYAAMNTRSLASIQDGHADAQRIYHAQNTRTGEHTELWVDGRGAARILTDNAWQPLSRERAARTLRVWHRAAMGNANMALSVFRGTLDWRW